MQHQSPLRASGDGCRGINTARFQYFLPVVPRRALLGGKQQGKDDGEHEARAGEPEAQPPTGLTGAAAREQGGQMYKTLDSSRIAHQRRGPESTEVRAQGSAKRGHPLVRECCGWTRRPPLPSQLETKKAWQGTNGACGADEESAVLLKRRYR